MKKNLFTLGLMTAAALTLTTNCNKNVFEEQANEPVIVTEELSSGMPFELVANSAKTRTTNDDVATDWAADDAITLFHRENGTSGAYGTNDQFTITSANLASEKFTGTLTEALETGKSYDWWAFYPYSAEYTTPANTTHICSIGGESRTLTGYGTKAHLAGTTMPMVGKATNVSYDATPSISMTHIASVAKIVVTNNSGENLVITSVALTAPEKIVGQFIVDFSDPANLTISNGTYSYYTANLKINSGTTIANGGTATFYIALKPINLAVDDQITVKVNTYSKTLTMTKAVSFTSGEVKTINFNYDKTFTSENFYPTSSITAGDKVIFTSGTSGSIKVMGHYSSGNNLPAVAGTVTSGRVASTSAMGVFTVAGNSSDGFSFYDPETETYLNATSTAKNYLKGVAAEDGYELWSVTITDGVVEALNKGTGKTSYHIRYNSSDVLFSAYTTTQSSVYLYKYDGRTPVAMSFDETSIAYTTSNYGTLSRPSLTVSPNVSAVTDAITYSIVDASGITTGFSSADGSYTLNGTAGTATITATFAGDGSYVGASASYTVSVEGTSLTPTFSFTSLPDGWPSGSNNTAIQALAGGNYDYTVSARTYTFTLSDDVGYHTSSKCLMVFSGKYVGLPAVSGYKLTKVVVGNTSGCSKSTVAKITTTGGGATVVSGGTSQTFSTQNSTYTYNLTGTSANTMYYISISSANCQIASLNLTYEKDN